MAPPERPGDRSPVPCPICPICEGVMELVYDRLTQQVCVCTDCHSGITIPRTAWEVQRQKRISKQKSET